MADNVMFNVNPDFDVAVFAERLSSAYKAKGFMVQTATINKSCIITFEKGTGGINTIL